jgi:hypothetical protein
MADGPTATCLLAGFVLLARRRYVSAALVVGLSGALRISGVGASAAFALAVLATCWTDPPRTSRPWLGRLGRAALIPLSAWGAIALSAYFWAQFHDPLLYIHAHQASHGHKGTPSVLLQFKPEWVIHAMDGTEHDLIWAGALLFAILVGHRAGLRRFSVPAQVYAYGVAAFVYVMSVIGTIDLFCMLGLSRYVLCVFTGFLCIGALLKGRPVALATLLFACAWHSREVDLCYYLGDVGVYGLRKCNMTQWIDY